MPPAIAVTFLRLLFAPLFAYFFIKSVRPALATPDPFWLWAAVTCVVLIEASDAVDGVLARARNEVTRLGKVFDPICDSISRQTIFISFMVVGIIPLWLYLVFMYRDAALSLIRIMCALDGTVIAARFSGKLKAILQATGTFLVLLVLALHAHGVEAVPTKLWGRHPGFWIMLFPAVFTFLSMFDYLVPNWHILKRMATPEHKQGTPHV